MARRRIPRDAVEQLLASREQVVGGSRGRAIYQSQVTRADGTVCLLRAVVDERVDPPVVITAYFTANVAKYWRQ